MKNTMKILALIAVSLTIIFTACKKDLIISSMDYEIASDYADLYIQSTQYETEIVKTLVKPDDCSYYTEGIIEYRVNGEVVATVDFGEGEKDRWALKNEKGEISDMDLKRKKEGYEYDKIIVKPLVKIEGCKYIVEGIIQYLKDDVVVATIDYGDGTCDEWATKTWDGGSKVFSMDLSKDKKGIYK